MRTYELMAVLAPDIAEDQMPAAIEHVSTFITNNGGEVSELITTSPWGRRRLAYPIRDYRDGFYALYHFTLDPQRIGEVERDLRLDAQVLRSLVTSYTPPKPKPPAEEPAEEGAEPAEGDAAPIEAQSGASMDTEVGTPTTGPDGEDLTEPPTAETPADEEEESVPART